MYCEYRHCRSRVMRTDAPWRARMIVRVGERDWLACERCADYLTTEGRLAGHSVSRTPFEAMPGHRPIAVPSPKSVRPVPIRAIIQAVNRRRPRSGAATRRALPGVPPRATNSVASSTSARARRKNPTPAEAILWTELSSRHLDGWKFRRQALVQSWIVPFYCPAARLAILISEDAVDDQACGLSEAKLRRAGLQVLVVKASAIKVGREAVRNRIRVALRSQRGAV